MKRYRILTNGQHYTVQRRICLGPINFWKMDHWLEVSESYPKVITHRAKFSDLAEAEEYVREQSEREGPLRRHGPFAKPKGWWTVN